MKLVFNNPFMKLKAKSMRKLHTITHMVTQEITHDKLFNNNDLISVSGMPKASNCSHVQLMANSYSGDTETKTKCLSTTENPYSNLYIATDGKHFQVAAVVTSSDEGNIIMTKREDIALIATSLATEEVPELHFLVSMKAS
jgi:hypothetical protein